MKDLTPEKFELKRLLEVFENGTRALSCERINEEAYERN
jgi:hypothetical protein